MAFVCLVTIVIVSIGAFYLQFEFKWRPSLRLDVCKMARHKCDIFHIDGSHWRQNYFCSANTS